MVRIPGLGLPGKKGSRALGVHLREGDSTIVPDPRAVDDVRKQVVASSLGIILPVPCPGGSQGDWRGIVRGRGDPAHWLSILGGAGCLTPAAVVSRQLAKKRFGMFN